MELVGLVEHYSVAATKPATKPVLYAIREKKRVEPEKGETAACPDCDAAVLAKCGSIKAWHWAHRADETCDPWRKEETEWHLAWKRKVTPEACEVKIGNHRADIVGNNGIVLELQRISPEEIGAREVHYRRMIWLFDARRFNLDIRLKDSWVNFRWKHPHRSIWVAKKPVFFDLGTWVLHVRKIHREIPCGGWGYPLDLGVFMERYLGLVLREPAPKGVLFDALSDHVKRQRDQC